MILRTVRRRLLVLFGILFLVIGGLAVSGSAAQTVIPAMDLTPVHPDGPVINIPPVNTIAPTTNPNAIPTIAVTPFIPVRTPIIPPVDIPNVNTPTPTPTLTPIFPVETLEPTPTMALIFPVETEETEEPTVPPTPVPTATIKVRTAVCDNQGFDPYLMFEHRLADFQAECTSADPGFEFKLSQLDGTVETKSTTAGEVTFTVPGTGDDVLLVQTLATGYSMPVVACEDSLAPTVPPLLDPTDRAGFFPVAGQVVTCTFFNVLATTDINLILFTMICPATYDIDNPTGWGGMANPQEACSYLGGGSTFTLSDSDPATADRSATVGTPYGGKVSFLDLTPGTFTITLTPPVGTASSFLFNCNAFYPREAPPFTLTPLGKGFTQSLTLTQAGKTVFCNWFLVPAKSSGSSGLPLVLPLLAAASANIRQRRTGNPLRLG